MKALSIISAALFIGFCGYLTYRSGLNFDEAYNIIPFQNLGLKGIFEYRYGDRYMPFNPWVSTGPLVYLPFSMIGLAPDHISAVFVTRAFVMCGFIFLLLLACQRFTKKTPLLYFVAMLGLLIPSFTEFAKVSFLTLDGEFYAAVFAFLACHALAKDKLGLSSLWLALSILTKKIMLVTLPAISILWAFRLFRRAGHWRKFGLLPLLVMGGLSAHIGFRVLLPKIVLSKEQMVVYEREKQGWEDFSKHHGLMGLDFISQDVEQHKSWENSAFKAMIGRKVEALRTFSDSSTPTYFLVGLFMLAAFFWGTSSQRWLIVGCLAIAGPIFAWWMILNEAEWYRYYAPVDATLMFLSMQFGADWVAESKWRPRAIAYTFVVFTAIGAFGKFDIINQQIAIKFASKAEQVAAANYVDGQLDDYDLYGWGWFQAPELQVLARRQMSDIEGAIVTRDFNRLKSAAQGAVYIKSPISGSVDQKVIEATSGRADVVTISDNWKIVKILF